MFLRDRAILVKNAGCILGFTGMIKALVVILVYLLLI